MFRFRWQREAGRCAQCVSIRRRRHRRHHHYYYHHHRRARSILARKIFSRIHDAAHGLQQQRLLALSSFNCAFRRHSFTCVSAVMAHVSMAWSVSRPTWVTNTWVVVVVLFMKKKEKRRRKLLQPTSWPNMCAWLLLLLILLLCCTYFCSSFIPNQTKPG